MFYSLCHAVNNGAYRRATEPLSAEEPFTLFMRLGIYTLIFCVVPVLVWFNEEPKCGPLASGKLDLLNGTQLEDEYSDGRVIFETFGVFLDWRGDRREAELETVAGDDWSVAALVYGLLYADAFDSILSFFLNPPFLIISIFVMWSRYKFAQRNYESAVKRIDAMDVSYHQEKRYLTDRLKRYIDEKHNPQEVALKEQNHHSAHLHSDAHSKIMALASLIPHEVDSSRESAWTQWYNALSESTVVLTALDQQFEFFDNHVRNVVRTDHATGANPPLILACTLFPSARGWAKGDRVLVTKAAKDSRPQENYRGTVCEDVSVDESDLKKVEVKFDDETTDKYFAAELSHLPQGPSAEPKPEREEKLRAELSELKLGALNKCAMEVGVDEVAIEAAMDSDDPKAALTDALMVHLLPGNSTVLECTALVTLLMKESADAVVDRISGTGRTKGSNLGEARAASSVKRWGAKTWKDSDLSNKAQLGAIQIGKKKEEDSQSYLAAQIYEHNQKLHQSMNNVMYSNLVPTTATRPAAGSSKPVRTVSAAGSCSGGKTAFEAEIRANRTSADAFEREDCAVQ
jgi:hypothetical protein